MSNLALNSRSKIKLKCSRRTNFQRESFSMIHQEGKEWPEFNLWRSFRLSKMHFFRNFSNGCIVGRDEGRGRVRKTLVSFKSLLQGYLWSRCYYKSSEQAQRWEWKNILTSLEEKIKKNGSMNDDGTCKNNAEFQLTIFSTFNVHVQGTNLLTSIFNVWQNCKGNT